MKKYIIAIIALLQLAACRKELDIDYHDIDEIVVINGYVSNEKAEVEISLTRNMDLDTSQTKFVTDANVYITDNNGNLTPLHHFKSGKYLPSSAFKGVANTEYTLHVEIGNDTYTSTCTMPDSLAIIDEGFYWENFLFDSKAMTYQINFQDDEQISNYIYLQMFKNGKLYLSNLESDKYIAFGLFPIINVCHFDEDYEDDDEVILHNSDLMEIEIRHIDRHTYDYLYALSISDNTEANPPQNYISEKTCLGYFSAFSVQRITRIFEEVE